MGISLYILMLTISSSLNSTVPLPLENPDMVFASFPLVLFSEAQLAYEDEDINDQWFAMDKFWHWSMSFALVGAFYHLTNVRLGQEKNIAALETLAFTLVCGIAKEFYDVYNEKLFSFKDLVYDILGMATGYFVFIY